MRQNFIEVSNSLPEDVYCVPSFNYPDTTLSFTDKDRILANDSIYFLPAAGTKKLFYKPLCDKATWNRLNPKDTLQVFVFEENTLKSKAWNEIAANKLYVRRIALTYNDILVNGCKVKVN